MENPEDLLVTLEGQVERLRVIHRDAEEPLTDDVTEVLHFCQNLEAILRHQQKERVSFWGERRDYWHYLAEGSGRGMKNLNSLIKQVQTLSQLATGQGRGRALVRLSLSEYLLADCIQNAISNTRRTKEWYHPGAILLSPPFSQRLISALYDLVDVTFNLPLDGTDLDETWPSFVPRSFQSTESRKSLFSVLSPSTKEAKVAEKSHQRPVLERAVEEHPTEIFVRQEIPFDLALVGALLEEIRRQLETHADHSDNHLHNSLPELQVANLDDVTSCLTLLRDYAIAWSHDVTKNRSVLEEQLKRSGERATDLELQVKETISESESSESGLLEKLQDTRDELRACREQLHRVSDENTIVKSQLSETRQSVAELEALNFVLEEQLIAESGGEGEGGGQEEVDGGGERRRRRAYTLLEATLGEKDKDIQSLSEQREQDRVEITSLRSQLSEAQRALHAIAACQSLLQAQVVSECESKAAVAHSLRQSGAELERLRQHGSTEELQTLRESLQSYRSQDSALQAQCAELEAQNSALSSEVEGLKLKLDADVKGLTVKLEQERDRYLSLKEERDRAAEELGSVQALIEHETQSLRFQLSTQAIELQETKKQTAKKETVLLSLRSSLAQLEEELESTRELCSAADEQVEELKQELQDVESVLHTSREEMTSLNEQLAVKTLSRDQERAQMLKCQNDLDSTQTRLQQEKQELVKQMAKLSSENQDIRRAFKKLLQQKVTLWQHADDLEQEQVSKGKWIDSRTVSQCMGCEVLFTVFNRKHHCRSCGQVFCTKCCEKKVQLPSSKDPLRVCIKCDKRISQLRTPAASKLINTLEDSSLPSSLPPSSSPLSVDSEGGSLPRTSSSSPIVRSFETSGNSLQAKLLLQNADVLSSTAVETSDLSSTAVETSDSGTEAGDRGELREDRSPLSFAAPGDVENSLDTSELFTTAPASINLAGLDTGSPHSCNSTEYMVDPEVKKRESEVDYSITAIEGSTADDSYYLIDTKPKGSEFPVGLDSPGSTQLDVSALASKLASLEQSSASVGVPGLGQDHSLRRQGSSSYTEVVLEGGGALLLPITVEKGTVVAWEFSTEPKGIAFGISCKTNVKQNEEGESSSQDEKETEVLPLRRCMSHKATLSGEYVAQKAGVYILHFDNCHSKYGGRKLLYKVWTKPAP